MSTVTSSLKQIPLNGGYFRSVSANTAGDCSGHIYTMTLTNGVASSPTLFAAAPASYNGLLRDMGVQYVVSGITYRRVQIVPSGTPGVSGNVSTTYPDRDYDVGYIIVGRTGGTPSVFVRTG